MATLRTIYQLGTVAPGWRCYSCRREFRHHHSTRRVFARLVAHTLVRHRRLPHLVRHAYMTAVNVSLHYDATTPGTQP